ncbi:Ribonuclease H-like domain [Plasmopara halstedii]|uniref:Ribonuclease H-like domain n=1 Tax=Plasmopara halstedii TaxID=4781 RepID=A0A0P1AI58_PLAHL|nr:Ribonuclease H-like domain [Plasmopara halstedii]CEG40845.1 Ribonuclease H-like domain [Plasmopara halstedii]|eukprot:XP_024577214.1 Ribonuclease H-like domain [Plasmopara halstedii]
MVSQPISAPSLYTAINVHWNSHLSMLESILRNRSEIETFLHSQDDEDRIALLQQLCQGFKRGTSWDYVLALVSIMGSQLPQMLNDIKFAPAAMKHNVRAVIAVFVKANISNKCVPDVIHEVAYLLHPLSKVVAADHDGVRAATLAHMGNMAATFPYLLHQETETGLAMEGIDPPPNLRKPCSKRSCDAIWERSCRPKKFWKAVSFRAMRTKDAYVYFDILGYWNFKASKFPLLVKLSSFVLAIPASSAECERSFCNASFIKSVLRSAFFSDSLEGNIVLRDNPDLLEKYFGEIEESDTEPEYADQYTFVLFKVIT